MIFGEGAEVTGSPVMQLAYAAWALAMPYPRELERVVGAFASIDEDDIVRIPGHVMGPFCAVILRALTLFAPLSLCSVGPPYSVRRDRQPSREEVG
jgi:hypothetical protein